MTERESERSDGTQQRKPGDRLLSSFLLIRKTEKLKPKKGMSPASEERSKRKPAPIPSFKSRKNRAWGFLSKRSLFDLKR